MDSELYTKYFVKGLVLFIKRLSGVDFKDIYKEYLDILAEIFPSKCCNSFKAAQLYYFEKGYRLDVADFGRTIDKLDMEYIYDYLYKLTTTVKPDILKQLTESISEEKYFKDNCSLRDKLLTAIDNGIRGQKYIQKALNDNYINETVEKSKILMERLDPKAVGEEMVVTGHKAFQQIKREVENSRKVMATLKKEHDGVKTTQECPETHLPVEARKNPRDTYDMVVHPKHYNTYSKETIDMMLDIWGPEATATWCEMTAFKYRMRMGTKPGDNSMEQELEKEKWYLEKSRELREKTKQTNPLDAQPNQRPTVNPKLVWNCTSTEEVG